MKPSYMKKHPVRWLNKKITVSAEDAQQRKQIDIAACRAKLKEAQLDFDEARHAPLQLERYEYTEVHPGDPGYEEAEERFDPADSSGNWTLKTPSLYLRMQGRGRHDARMLRRLVFEDYTAWIFHWWRSALALVLLRYHNFKLLPEWEFYRGWVVPSPRRLQWRFWRHVWEFRWKQYDTMIFPSSQRIWRPRDSWKWAIGRDFGKDEPDKKADV